MLVLLIGGCAKGAEADLPAIGEARSLAAEWALVNEQAARGNLTDVYVQTMRRQLRQQLQSAKSSLSRPDARYGRDMQALLAEPDDAAPGALRAYAANLRAIEDSLESD
ncbi:MAG TPA: hypothetical protein VE221_03225 [Sphingomicrobium sp.]|nr:hypothetical protein [Sphingomicrobium sp.]